MTRLPPYIETAWVEGAHEISGLDHLGVKGPCISIYGQLLPGITNVFGTIIAKLYPQNHHN